MLVLLICDTLFAYIRRFFVIRLSERVDIRLHTYVFDKLLNFPIDFFERTRAGLITQRVFLLSTIREFLEGVVFGTVLNSAMLLFFLPVMFVLEPFTTCAMVAVCALMGLLAWRMAPTLRRKAEAARSSAAIRGTFLLQTIYGIRTIKSLVLEPRRIHQWDLLSKEVEKTRIDFNRFDNLMSSIMKPLEALAVNGGLALAVYFSMASDDPTYAGALYFFVILARQTITPVGRLVQSAGAWEEARAQIAATGWLVNRAEEEGRAGDRVHLPIDGQIEFANVTFRYTGTRSPALQDVSFQIKPGTTLGLVGRSGSGKSTITRLLQALHSDYEGEIRIDGVDLRKYDVDHLRRSQGVVLQENFLFTGSIKQNIMASRTEASYDEVVHAARLAGADEFIDRLPRGYETHIYEGSPNLSGGQRQRIAIARALITDPRILIFDEATSALDPESEAVITTNLARMAHGRTVIIVSHRLSSLVNSDAIVVLEHGRFQDIGRHEELLRRCEIYRHLWNEQNRYVTAPSRPGKPPPLRSPQHAS